uniref:Copine C-terminal domain-containing protein n=1 Tax=Aegilops tauschii subsp. strangulata TaxID=200361 RepID=A0A452YZ45_AEGTS
MPVATTNLLGSLQTTIAQLENLYNSKAGANFYSHKGQKKLKGQLFLDKFQEKVQHTFLDYISSGFELNFMVAVDFTASNGDPRVPQSLHYIDPSGRPNSYQQAILGVSEVLQFYDNDRRFPAWGFGAKIPRGSVSHCFNLNASTNDCERFSRGANLVWASDQQSCRNCQPFCAIWKQQIFCPAHYHGWSYHRPARNKRFYCKGIRFAIVDSHRGSRECRFHSNEDPGCGLR